MVGLCVRVGGVCTCGVSVCSVWGCVHGCEYVYMWSICGVGCVCTCGVSVCGGETVCV